MTISASGTGQRNARGQSAAAAGDDDPAAGGAGSELLDDLEARRALPGDDRRIVEARHDGRAVLGGDPRGDRLAAFGAPVVEDDLGALRPRALDLHLRRVGRHDDDRRGCRAASRRWPRPAHDCPRRRRRRRAPAPPAIKLQQPVGRAAQLERAAGLQAFAFQPDAGPRSALSISGVRSTAPAIRSPAARTSSRVTSASLSKLLDTPVLSPNRCSVTTELP